MSDPSDSHDGALPNAAAVASELTAEAHTQMPQDSVASTIGAPISEAPATMAPSPVMPAPERFNPGDLAVDRNPVTAVQAPLADHAPDIGASSSTTIAVEAPPDYTPRRASCPDPAPPRATSATGWLVPPAATPISRITFDEYLSLSEITFEWGDSYDDKDWMRLRAILAPTLTVDYTEVNGHKWDSMPASDFVGIMSHIGFVGDPLVHTQHHIGASKWQKISDDEVIGHHQLRAAHQRYADPDLKIVENKGNGHAMVQHSYRKVDGEWKLAGLRPTVRWNEFEFEKIFTGI